MATLAAIAVLLLLTGSPTARAVPTLTAPNATSKWEVLQTYSVTWSGHDNGATNVRVLLAEKDASVLPLGYVFTTYPDDNSFVLNVRAASFRFFLLSATNPPGFAGFGAQQRPLRLDAAAAHAAIQVRQQVRHGRAV